MAQDFGDLPEEDYFTDSLTGYGDASTMPLANKTGKRRPWLPAGIVFLVPVIQFIVVFGAMSFSYSAGWVFFAIGAVLTFAAVVFEIWCCWRASDKRGKANIGDSDNAIIEMLFDSRWNFLLALLMLIALVFGAFFGYENYQEHAWEYTNHDGMGSYRDIDPESTKSSLLMDASYVTFLPGFAPDAAQAMGFKNRHTYCVAPIRSIAAAGNATEGSTFDYWAVGIDCCTAYGENFIYSFRCGEYANPEAHGGLRIVGEAEKSYYRLAVQQAEATQGVKSPHPVFVKWTTDYPGELNSYYLRGKRNVAIGVIICVVVQAIVVTMALMLLEVIPKMMNAWHYL